MINQKFTRKPSRRVASVAAVCALGVSLAACSSSDDNNAVETQTVTSTVQESAAPTSSAQGSSNDTSAAAPQGGQSELISMSIDGKPVDKNLFSPVRCELDSDDGREVLEVDFSKNDDRNEMDIDIYTDGPALKELDLERDDIDYELDDVYARSAVVTFENGVYKVTGNPIQDNTHRTIALSVEFRCGR